MAARTRRMRRITTCTAGPAPRPMPRWATAWCDRCPVTCSPARAVSLCAAAGARHVLRRQTSCAPLRQAPASGRRRRVSHLPRRESPHGHHEVREMGRTAIGIGLSESPSIRRRAVQPYVSSHDKGASSRPPLPLAWQRACRPCDNRPTTRDSVLDGWLCCWHQLPSPGALASARARRAHPLTPF